MELKSTKPAEYKEIRTAMKAVNFGLLYGMGVGTLWNKLIAQGFSYPKQEVARIHKVWTDTYSGIAKYKDFCEQQIQEIAPSARHIPHSSTVLTSLRGRVARKAKAVTSSYNFPIQSTCADILKTAIRLFVLAKQLGFIDADVFIVLTAHDEIVFQCPKNKTETTKQKVNQLLLETANTILQSQQSKIKCGVDIGVGDSWAAKP